jgi:tRNA1(Val) A37 N6-methylase TrmN6
VLLDMGAGIGKALMAAWAFWNVQICGVELDKIKI